MQKILKTPTTIRAAFGHQQTSLPRAGARIKCMKFIHRRELFTPHRGDDAGEMSNPHLKSFWLTGECGLAKMEKDGHA